VDQEVDALAEAVGAHRDDWADYIENDPQGQQVMPFITALAGEFVQEKRRLTATVDRVRERAQYIADIVRNQSPGGVGRLNLKDIDPRDTIARAIRLVKDSNRAPSTRVDIDCDKAPKEIRIDEIGPSLRWATASVTRTPRRGGDNWGGGGRPAARPPGPVARETYGPDEAPF